MQSHLLGYPGIWEAFPYIDRSCIIWIEIRNTKQTTVGPNVLIATRNEVVLLQVPFFLILLSLLPSLGPGIRSPRTHSSEILRGFSNPQFREEVARIKSGLLVLGPNHFQIQADSWNLATPDLKTTTTTTSPAPATASPAPATATTFLHCTKSCSMQSCTIVALAWPSAGQAH